MKKHLLLIAGVCSLLVFAAPAEAHAGPLIAAVVELLIAVFPVLGPVGALGPTTILTAQILATAIVGAGLSFGLGAISKALAPDVDASLRNLTGGQDRLVTVKQAIVNHRIGFGRSRTGGAFTFAHTTNGNNTLHQLVTVTGHPVHAFDEFWLNDERAVLDGSDLVTNTEFANQVTITKGLGTTAGDAALLALLTVDTAGVWSSRHKQEGRSKAYYKYTFDRDAFAGGIPNPTIVMKLLEMLDPRTSTTIWNSNPALALRWFLNDTTYGFSIPDSRINLPSFISAANICDEQVVVVEASKDFTAATTDIITITTVDADDVGLQGLLYGNVIRVAVGSGGTLPSGLSAGTDYFWFPITQFTGKVATSMANLLAQTFVDITDTGSGVATMTRKSELRYAVDGLFESSVQRGVIVEELLKSMGGTLVLQNGEWTVYAGAFMASSASYSSDNLLSSLSVDVNPTRRDVVNSVKGTHVDPYQNFQSVEYPTVSNATYLAQDQGDPLPKDVAFPLVSSPSQCERLAKIIMEDARQGIVFVADFGLEALKSQVGDTIAFTDDDFGWSGKLFRIMSWKLNSKKIGKDDPLLIVTMTLKETASGIWDWNSGEETTVDLAPNTNLPRPSDIAAPGVPIVTEELYVTANGQATKVRAIVAWGPSPIGLVDRYRVEFKVDSETEWTNAGLVDAQSALILNIDDLKEITYDFRVTATNVLGASSLPSSASKTFVGKTAIPVDMTSFNLEVVNNQVHLSWDLHPDIDVQVGGHIRIRYNPNTIGATWSNSFSMGQNLMGNTTDVTLPMNAGTYLAKAEDSSGNVSGGAVEAVTQFPQLLTMNVEATIAEDPAFTGVKQSVEKPVGNVIRLQTGQFIDDRLDLMDLWPLLDNIGGTNIAQFGTYFFANNIDLGSVQTARYAITVTSASVFQGDTIDSRSDNIDTWPNIDGGGGADGTDMKFYIRTTDDDPNASAPTWSAWAKFVIGEYTARGAEFKVELFSTQTTQNREISALGAVVDMPDRQDSDRNISSNSGGVKSITYAIEFLVIPAIGITANDLASGDYWTVTNQTVTGFDIEFFNSSDTRIVKNFDWIVKGY